MRPYIHMLYFVIPCSLRESYNHKIALYNMKVVRSVQKKIQDIKNECYTGVIQKFYNGLRKIDKYT